MYLHDAHARRYYTMVFDRDYSFSPQNCMKWDAEEFYNETGSPEKIALYVMALCRNRRSHNLPICSGTLEVEAAAFLWLRRHERRKKHQRTCQIDDQERLAMTAELRASGSPISARNEDAELAAFMRSRKH